MLIKKDSILYKLPKELSLKDLLLLDSLRFTTELIDLNYSSLNKELEDTSLNSENQNVECKKDLVPIFNYCWSIVDNLQRFIKLYKQLPSNNKHALISDLREISQLRNTFQHMDERIDECLLEGDMPFYGVISWEINLGVENLMHKFFAISGLYISRGKLEFKIEKRELPRNEIRNIKLQTFIRRGMKSNPPFAKKEISISDFMTKTKFIINEFEKNLEHQFHKQGVNYIDWTPNRDLLFKCDF